MRRRERLRLICWMRLIDCWLSLAFIIGQARLRRAASPHWQPRGNQSLLKLGPSIATVRVGRLPRQARYLPTSSGTGSSPLRPGKVAGSCMSETCLWERPGRGRFPGSPRATPIIASRVILAVSSSKSSPPCRPVAPAGPYSGPGRSYSRPESACSRPAQARTPAGPRTADS